MTTAPPLVDIFVRGLPKTKGSTRSFVKNGRAITTSDTKGLRAWQSAVSFVLQHASNGTPVDGPVAVTLTFHLLRPPSISRRRRPWPSVRPDLDKLERAVLDGMTGIVFRDDAQVCGLVTWKRYSDVSGVAIRAEQLGSTDADEPS